MGMIDFVIASFDSYLEAVDFCVDNLMIGVDIVEGLGQHHVIDVEGMREAGVPDAAAVA